MNASESTLHSLKTKVSYGSSKYISLTSFADTDPSWFVSYIANPNSHLDTSEPITRGNIAFRNTGFVRVFFLGPHKTV